MFVVLLKFSDQRSRAPEFMQAHKDWIKRGFEDGVFLLAGSLHENVGGGIFAHNTSLEALQKRVNEDPFIVHDVVTADVLEMSPSLADERLNFLLV